MRRRGLFKHIFAHGKRFYSPYISLICAEFDQELGRIAFLCYKRTGNAVLRNRIRRRLKAVFCHLNLPLNPRITLIIVGKKNCLACNYNDLSRTTFLLLQKNDLLI